jgi:hypothetical protein
LRRSQTRPRRCGLLAEEKQLWKGVTWALRMVGRRDLRRNEEAIRVGERLAASAVPSEWWAGRDAVQDLKSESEKVQSGLRKK